MRQRASSEKQRRFDLWKMVKFLPKKVFFALQLFLAPNPTESGVSMGQMGLMGLMGLIAQMGQRHCWHLPSVPDVPFVPFVPFG